MHRYRAAWLTRLAVRLYPDGRHEMLHQTNHAELIGALLDWFDAVISGGAAPRCLALPSRAPSWWRRV